MNKNDRAELDIILRKLDELMGEIEKCHEDTERIKSSEEEKYDNLPESLQDGQKGSDLQDGIEKLESICDLLDETTTNISEAIAEVGEMV